MSVYSDAVLALGPTHYWRMGSAFGASVPDEVGGESITFWGTGTPSVVSPGAIDGDVDTALFFNDPAGSQFHYGRTLSSFSPYQGAAQFTWSFWVRFQETADIAFLGTDDAGGDQLQFFMDRTGNVDHPQALQFVGAVGGSYAVLEGFGDFQTEFQHIVLTFDAGVLALYFNGVEVATTTATWTTLTSNAGYLLFGTEEWATFRAQVELDEVALFRGKALTPAEIATISVPGLIPNPADDRVARAYFKVATGAPIEAKTHAKVDTSLIDAKAYAKLATGTNVQAQTYFKVDTQIDPSGVRRTGSRWRPRLLIDGVDRSNLLTREFRYSGAVGKAWVANFDLVPPAGALSPGDYDGKPVSLYYVDLDDATGADGDQWERYAGTISAAEWRPIEGVLRCQATTQPRAKFEAMSKAQIDAELPGHWSSYVFTRNAKGWDRVRDRLETIDGDVWFLPDGGVLVVPWQQAVPAFEWHSSDLKTDLIRLRQAQRADMVNQVEVRMDYRYQRLRQRVISCQWSTGVTFCHRLQNPFTLAQRSQTEAAARGRGGWQLLGDVHYVPLPPAQVFICNGEPYGWGRLVGGMLLEDADNDALAWGAGWKVGRRWAQEVTERLVVRLKAPQSIEVNGKLAEVDEYGIRSEKDNSAWLTKGGYSDDNSGGLVSISGAAGASGSQRIGLGDSVHNVAEDTDAPGSREDFEQAQRTAFAAGRADIVRSHRHTVTCRSTFDPRVVPGVPMRCVLSKLTASGYVIGIRERFDVANGEAVTEVDLGVFQPGGAGLVVPSSIAPIPAIEQPPENAIPDSLYFGTYIGGLTTSTPYNPEWLGYTTNYEFDPTNTDPFSAEPVGLGNRLYPNQFTVEYPEISQAHRQAIELDRRKTINVEIPSDELVMHQ